MCFVEIDFNEDGKISERCEETSFVEKRRIEGARLRAYRNRRPSIIKKKSDFRGAEYLRLSRVLRLSEISNLPLFSLSLFLSTSLFLSD